MKTIATLTINPTIDVSYSVDRIEHTIKLRASYERYAPGGGGINVARVFVRLGGNARCIYLSGGPTGVAFDGLVDLHQLVRKRIATAQPTRMATAVFERSSGKEYRFTPAGPEVSEPEWRACLDALQHVECDVMVMSGSLAPGVPPDFYARAASILQARGIATVLDSSGEALKEGVAHGGHLLIKPNRVELEQITGLLLDSTEEVERAAMALVQQGHTELAAVTMGDAGAILASRDGIVSMPAIAVKPKSAVGAGDSFLAAMVHGLARRMASSDAFRFGIAAGTAAVMTPGSDLAQSADIEELFASLPNG